MMIFAVGQGRTRIDSEAYFRYVESMNPRRTPPCGKKTISGKYYFSSKTTVIVDSTAIEPTSIGVRSAVVIATLARG